MYIVLTFDSLFIVHMLTYALNSGLLSVDFFQFEVFAVVCGSEMVLQYSNFGRTKALNACSLMAGECTFKFDDSIIYKQIKNKEDAIKFQQDLDAAGKWEQDWLMHFHPDKCTVVSVTQKRKTISHTYQLHI
jgi:hypothetical protein